ncbi:glycosyltransferase [Cognatishimia maritima]|uniref:Glycosyltransferase involved in cell wall bisynthesis n=1 Tax=Cognatishimia maritima TaxID=870908 RepID=A0A1M5WFC9_9RHOB|nr:glycosyltransferase [Cognatishimia maritima]SHH86137.1 Glycosyltransferase involved in cell wall bisynthesis [Cognatishimia maritima]
MTAEFDVSQSAGTPHVTILMATYEGAVWLPEQLQSFTDQTHKNWQLLASDDGSADGTQDLLAAFYETHRGQLLPGPQEGSTANFKSLLLRAGDHMPSGGWLAFADQDDKWLPDRLSRGVAALTDVPEDQPALFCSRTWVVDEALENRRLSAPRPKPPAFRNALVQNIAAGNTILVNSAGARLLCAAAGDAEAFVVHDWWAYQMITGAGGLVLHEDEPTLLYRQHGNNAIGANLGYWAQLVRLWALLRGDLHAWSAVNVPVLQASSHRFTPENKTALALFSEMHSGRFLRRLQAFFRLRPYRQSRSGTCAIWIATLLKRV